MKKTKPNKPKKITDRAKRYRARKANVQATEHCYLCGAADPLDVEHLTGDESDNRAEALAPACRACNACGLMLIDIVFGLGRAAIRARGREGGER